jgi:hypothetical protein
VNSNPAAELRTAAETLLGLTAPMAVQHPGPWIVHNPNGYPQAVFSPDTDVILCETLDEIDAPKPSAPYIAAMHPGVGKALADWLQSAARDAVEIGPDPHALVVARAINAATPAP